ncbi:hypothetical protein ONS96_011737 [Cadophora gregata f. sp. sojae]|nr:hypothetical protein ONS96_011737 [Cadophora gregata f. sp. sojae]
MASIETESNGESSPTATSSIMTNFHHVGHLSSSTIAFSVYDLPSEVEAKSTAKARKHAKGNSNVLTGDFIRFPKFPVELQLIVWNFSLEPHTVEMKFLNHIWSDQFDFLSTTPAIIQVNRKVRQEFRKKYRVLFEHKMSRAPAYFNSDIDILHIRSEIRRSPMSSKTPLINIMQIGRTICHMPNKSDVRHLSVSPSFFPYNWSIFPSLLMFNNLETVTMSFVRSRHDCKHNSKLWTSAHGRSYISAAQPHEDEAVQCCRDLIKDFEDRLKAGEWGTPVWKMPKFIYKGSCLDMIRSSKMFCGSQRLEKAKRKRDAEEEDDWKYNYTSVQIQKMIKDREKRRKNEHRNAEKEAAKDMSWLPGHIKDLQATNWKNHRIILAAPRKSMSSKKSVR